MTMSCKNSMSETIIGTKLAVLTSVRTVQTHSVRGILCMTLGKCPNKPIAMGIFLVSSGSEAYEIGLWERYLSVSPLSFRHFWWILTKFCRMSTEAPRYKVTEMCSWVQGRGLISAVISLSYLSAEVLNVNILAVSAGESASWPASQQGAFEQATVLLIPMYV